jgi:hypothetical protein
LKYVKNTYEDEKKELFDEFFVYKALDELIPLTENDFNNFRDTIIDKHNRPGYLIYVDKYYIFQPFDQNENIPMYYRTNVTQHMSQELSLYNYLKNSTFYQQLKDSKSKKDSDKHDLIKDDLTYYDFETVMDYYDSRDENEYVGLVDKESSRRKSKTNDENLDVFKIREKRGKILAKKRETGLSSFKGSVCTTSKSKQYLEKVAKKIGANVKNIGARNNLCTLIQERLLYLEKYATDKDKNKKTYCVVPFNHPIYPFPYNLEDRSNYIIDKIKNEISSKIDINVTTKKLSSNTAELNELIYTIHIKDNANIKNHIDFLKGLNAEKVGSEYIINLS